MIWAGSNGCNDRSSFRHTNLKRAYVCIHSSIPSDNEGWKRTAEMLRLIRARKYAYAVYWMKYKVMPLRFVEAFSSSMNNVASDNDRLKNIEMLCQYLGAIQAHQAYHIRYSDLNTCITIPRHDNVTKRISS